MKEKDSQFSNSLIAWYLENARILPWRSTRDPYLVWLSEIILQQTRVDQGMPYYNRFSQAFPTVHHLADASEETVFKLWQGLGYYSRARNLHFTAKYVSNELDGVFPTSYSELIKLKGVGDYTASAIASICSDEAQAVVDGNVYRVLSRVFGLDTPIDTTLGKRQFRELAQQLIDPKQPGTYNQAIMEFGARYCVPRNPTCEGCIFQSKCVGYKLGKVGELPVKKGKTKVRPVYHNYLVVTSEDGKTLLEKREGRGIWQGLYQFPMTESDQPIGSALPDTVLELYQSKYGLRSVIRYKEEPVIHLLSHRKIYAHFWILQTEELKKEGVDYSRIEEFAVPVLLDNFIREFPVFASGK
ncbi:A/G-specific adenine glycosylase [Aureitalea marina]|uniref:Adenine DNA glycosylase n=1 Tax=Aureitalea marina TaxID=930804 RepID=A0A2S7KSS1_9FLAO|nr:A/G-specific adenine glycosylase [Aureitalea marina]PQB05679.1 A/G-specific adenine glycosylase [Aureitalea marina]